MRVLVILAACLGLAACQDETRLAQVPQPIAMTEEALGHFCQMHIIDHEGPKAQVYLEGHPAPLWFSQVRDGIAFLKSEERSARVVAFYVNDMGAAESWAVPGSGNWIPGDASHFVIGSDAIGGMGAPEVVPFSDPQAAAAFAQERGGSVKSLADIPAETVLSPVEAHHHAGGSAT